MANRLGSYSLRSHTHTLLTGKNVGSKHSKYILIEERGAKIQR